MNARRSWNQRLGAGLNAGVSAVVIALLRGYQLVLSPLMTALGARCRFAPSCSQYMIDAVRMRGAVVGVGLGLWRLARCNPWNRGGYDPVAPARVKPASQFTQDVSRETS